MFLCSRLVDHSEALSPNSNRVINNSTPRYLRISPGDVGVFPFACSSRLVSRHISFSCKGGYVRRNSPERSARRCPARHSAASPVGVRSAHGLY
jgi:hypothetical protein